MSAAGPLRLVVLGVTALISLVILGAPPAQGQTAESYAGLPEWWGRFAAVKEFSGTFLISFDYTATSDPDGTYAVWQGSERWSVGGSVHFTQQEENPLAWKGDGEASMHVAEDTLTGVHADLVYRDSLRAAGRVRLATEGRGSRSPRSRRTCRCPSVGSGCAGGRRSRCGNTVGSA